MSASKSILIYSAWHTFTLRHRGSKLQNKPVMTDAHHACATTSVDTERPAAETGGPACNCAPETPPDCYLIVYNVSKKHNVGTLARCECACTYHRADESFAAPRE